MAEAAEGVEAAEAVEGVADGPLLAAEVAAAVLRSAVPGRFHPGQAARAEAASLPRDTLARPIPGRNIRIREKIIRDRSIRTAIIGVATASALIPMPSARTRLMTRVSVCDASGRPTAGAGVASMSATIRTTITYTNTKLEQGCSSLGSPKPCGRI